MIISMVCALRDMSSKERVVENIRGSGADEVIFIEGRNPSLQRNYGASLAAGDIIYFIDDDSIVAEGIALIGGGQFLEDSGLSVVGGPELSPDSDTLLQKVFGLVFSSPFASGSSSARYYPKGKRRISGEKELILSNMMVRKDIFISSGGFNEKLYPNEENEFLNRLKYNGFNIVYDPAFFIYRSKRKNLWDFIKQCFNYGKGRAEQSVAAFDMGSLVNFIPAFFVMYILAELFFGASERLPFLFYAALDIVFSVSVGLKLKNYKAVLLAVAAFFLLHISYGCGTIYGLYTGFKMNNKNLNTTINTERVNLK